MSLAFFHDIFVITTTSHFKLVSVVTCVIDVVSRVFVQSVWYTPRDETLIQLVVSFDFFLLETFLIATMNI